MTSYYQMPCYYPLDLTRAMQMPNIMEVEHMGWEQCEKLPDSECDTCEDDTKEDTGPTELNPEAPDFNPGASGLTDQHDWLVADQKSDYECVLNVGADQLKMSAVSMDLVLAANYILNDVFSFIAPEPPLVEDLPQYHINQNIKFSKKSHYTNAKNFRSSSPCSVELVKPEISYEKEELMELAKSPLCQVTPQAWPMIAKKMPRLVRREGPTANIIIKEVRAIKKQGETGIRDINNNS